MIQIYNEDCLKAMKEMPDDSFDLAICDPPYGIGGGSCTTKKVKWDDTQRPSAKYFEQLQRVSKNQVIWGGNYFSDLISFPSKHTLIWDKQNGDSFMSDGEIAFTSFNKNTTRFFRLFWMSNMMKSYEKPIIHPTQKPIALYTWILSNYAKKGWKILDTHLGSGSIAIACHNMNYDLTAFEIDSEYYEAALKRLQNHQKQLKLF